MTEDVEDARQPKNSGEEVGTPPGEGHGVRIVKASQKRAEDWKLPIRVDDSPEWALPGFGEAVKSPSA